VRLDLVGLERKLQNELDEDRNFLREQWRQALPASHWIEQWCLQPLRGTLRSCHKGQVFDLERGETERNCNSTQRNVARLS